MWIPLNLSSPFDLKRPLQVVWGYGFLSETITASGLRITHLFPVRLVLSIDLKNTNNKNDCLEKENNWL
ncbi:hypothetical protein AL535_018250 [Vibrio cholerae]|nr:hypothetical protein AL535_018250 [Vibrio cholerae]